MESVKYSIIVPVYNAEQFLERCIKSLIGQTYKNFEVFLLMMAQVTQVEIF